MDRNLFYEKGYRRQSRIILWLCGLCGILVIALIGSISFTPEPRYVAIDGAGRIIPVPAMSEPYVSQDMLISWAAETATKVYTYNFRDYRERFTETSQRFTDGGWNSFQQAFDETKIIDRVLKNRLTVSAAPRSAPVIIREFVDKGKMSWHLQMPIVVTYESASERSSDQLLVDMVVERVDPRTSIQGIGVSQFIARQYSGG